MQPLLKPTKARTRIFLASAEIVSILNIKLLNTLAEIVSIISFILIPEPKNFFCSFISSHPEAWGKYFQRNKRNVCFSVFASPILELENFISLSKRNFFRVFFFFFELGKFPPIFLIFGAVSSISPNMRKNFVSGKYKKVSFPEI